METIAGYFAHIPAAHRSLILVGGIAFFWMLEQAAPLFAFRYSKTKHAGVNLFFTLTTILVNFPLAFLLLKTSQWAVANGVGVLQWVPPLPLWATVLAGLLLLDLVGAWLAHFTQHQVRWLWQFHAVHHSDVHVDTTTANRHHPGESLVRFGFTLLAVGLVGAPMWLVFLYQSLSVVLSQFNHANIELPGWLNQAVGWLVVTPNMHHVHHHYVLPYSNTNYGNIFSVWDRLFTTYAERAGHELVYGLDTHPAPHEQSHIGGILATPFRPYRPPVGEKQAQTV